MKTAAILSTLRSRAWLSVLAAAGIFGTTSPLHAAVTTYTSQSAFINALQDPAYFESFNEYGSEEVPSPQSFSFGPVGFTLSDNDPYGIFYSDGGGSEGSVFPSTEAAVDSFVLTFTGSVYAVGGTFFLSDINYNSLADGSVTATLATGQSIVLASTDSYNTQPFGGFTSTTPITSLTLTGPVTNTDGTYAFVSLDNLYVSGVAAVPEPSTWVLAFAGAAGLGLLVLRRRTVTVR